MTVLLSAFGKSNVIVEKQRSQGPFTELSSSCTSSCSSPWYLMSGQWATRNVHCTRRLSQHNRAIKNVTTAHGPCRKDSALLSDILAPFYILDCPCETRFTAWLLKHRSPELQVPGLSADMSNMVQLTLALTGWALGTFNSGQTELHSELAFA